MGWAGFWIALAMLIVAYGGDKDRPSLARAAALYLASQTK